MDLWLIWVIAGFVLVIAELLTGTFYLLVIGAGAFAGAAVAWVGANGLVQALIGGAVALIGTWVVNIWHRGQRPHPDASNFLDRGQPVVLETWSNEAAGMARVKYRGTTWEARVMAAGEPLVPGATLYIEGQEGGMLLVGAAPPAR